MTRVADWRRFPVIAGLTTHTLALADQAIVSGASFIAMVLVGRRNTADELGIYATGISVLISLVYV